MRERGGHSTGKLREGAKLPFIPIIQVYAVMKAMMRMVFQSRCSQIEVFPQTIHNYFGF